MPRAAEALAATPPMPAWAGTSRAQDLQRLGGETFDLLVIGGGITGAGIALDAAARGLRVALVDKGDFAAGTSSRSSKLIHGGLRYLRQGQLHTTLECSREKALLRRLAPHLVQDIPFLLPIPRGSRLGLPLRLGLTIYDLAAGFPRGLRHRHLTAEQAQRRWPRFPADRCAGAFEFWDARADDSRLTLHVLARAVQLGAVAVSYAAVEGFEVAGGTIRAARVRDVLGTACATVAARVLVNATGVWCDRVRAHADGGGTPLLRPSKGIHLVVSRARVGAAGALAFLDPGSRRSGLLVPWGERAVLGTTDHDYQGDLDQPRADAADIDEVLATANGALGLALTRADVLATYAGLRPLLLHGAAETRRVPRDDRIEAAPSGLLTITGGKLTTYRRMARRVVDRVVARLGRRVPSPTHALTLFAAQPSDDPLVAAYGSEAARVRELAPDDTPPLAKGVPWLRARARYALRFERAARLTDILCRRTRAVLYAEDQGRAAANVLAHELAAEAGWDPARELAAFARELALYAP